MKSVSHADSSRRPSVHAIPVDLGPAGVWWIAQPTEWLFPIILESRDIRPCSRFGFSPQIERLRDRFQTAIGGDQDAELCRAFLLLAFALLNEAHDLDAESLMKIIADADRPRLVSSVLSLAFPPGEGYS